MFEFPTTKNKFVAKSGGFSERHSVLSMAEQLKLEKSMRLGLRNQNQTLWQMERYAAKEQPQSFQPFMGNMNSRENREEELSVEQKRELYIQECAMRAALRKQNRPLWAKEVERLPEEQQKKFAPILETLNKEKNTEAEVAEEEAYKAEEDIQELIVDKKAKTYAEASVKVFEQEEYQLKTEECIKKEEAVRPEVLAVEKYLQEDNPQAALEIIKNASPDKKEIFSAIPHVFDRALGRAERKCNREGDVNGLAQVLEVKNYVFDQFDLKNLDKMDPELRQSPVFVAAAKQFLQNKLDAATNFFCAEEIKEYIWMREELIKSGTVGAAEIDTNPAVQYKLTTILIGKSPEDKIIFIEHVERYQYLKNQLEVAGILEKDAADENPRVQEAFFSLLDNSLEKKENRSDTEVLERYMKIRARLAEYAILGKQEMDYDLKIQENLQDLLLRQFSAQVSDKEKLNNFLGFYQTMLQEDMLPPEEQKKFKQDKKLSSKIQTALAGAIMESPSEERPARYADFRQRIGVTELVTYETIDRWEILAENEPKKQAI